MEMSDIFPFQDLSAATQQSLTNLEFVTQAVSDRERYGLQSEMVG